MKTFLFSIPSRLKLKDLKLDAEAALCNKPWTVFNDEGIKQLFIFRPDGSLLITTNGIVVTSKWEFISANRSLIITSEGQSVMFHPAFLDDVVFALQQDGDQSTLFMIDENNSQDFQPKTLTELGGYFVQKEQLLIANEHRQLEAIRIEGERKRKEAEEQEILRLKRESIRDKYAEEIRRVREETEKKQERKTIGIVILISGLLATISGGFIQNAVIVLIGVVICVLGIIIIATGDVNPDKEEDHFIDSKIEQESQ